MNRPVKWEALFGARNPKESNPDSAVYGPAFHFLTDERPDFPRKLLLRTSALFRRECLGVRQRVTTRQRLPDANGSCRINVHDAPNNGPRYLWAAATD